MFNKLFGRNREDDAVHDLYVSLVTQARNETFFRELGVPDSLDGRFDLLTLHMFLVLRRLKAQHEHTAGFSQKLFDLMFRDMDLSLREAGVGDVGVGKRVKAMVQGFYGRIAAYEEALGSGREALSLALQRNLYGTVEVNQESLERMCGYIEEQQAALAAIDVSEILSGKTGFRGMPDLQ
ncbi:ubiquinol-cytochrome C chaperone family protein [Kiloniella laminariae]|uniref:Ubiquinol-cytochrome C chaperone family protein n=1 Tax=Kiloniella laminariae TaxID=454162 RepID=A0ABT4LGA4_9PROT|nr:ubiquinol-cytochrome C chaperone family protein [Kiloniella laminariae]MCZ4280131.1 ubiquinol-cytochrome C chaperone family protein [Kiloniella laminariae]